jgi:Endoribonuclease L-PSP
VKDETAAALNRAQRIHADGVRPGAVPGRSDGPSLGLLVGVPRVSENDSVLLGFHGARSQIMPAIHHVDVPNYPAAHSPYSHAVVANGFVFVSGQIPVKPGGGPTEVVGGTTQEQTRQAMRNVQTILKAAGSLGRSPRGQWSASVRTFLA